MSYRKVGTINGLNKYKIIIEAGYIDGKRTRKKETFIGTAEEVKKREIELKQEFYHINKIKINDNKNLTFQEFSEKFINDYCKNPISEVGKTTLKNYEYMLEKINEKIGDEKIKSITTKRLDDLYGELAIGKKGQKLSSKTISHYHNLLSLMFKKAKKWDDIKENPHLEVEPIKIVKSNKKAYDLRQVNLLLKCLENERIKYRTIIILALVTAARRSELCALRWPDIDFEEKRIYIDNSLKVVKGEVDEEKAKTPYSVRYVYLDNAIIKLLKEYKKWQDDYILKMGNKWLGTNRVFTAINGKHIHPDTCNKILSKILKKYNLPHLSFHELRHTNNSLLKSYNVSTHTISKNDGHSSEAITKNTYIHKYEDDKRQCATVFENILNSYSI